ncbi:GDYXXLXY domain-containing protein [Shewanella litorisediminis]|uniref:GDYXXLXY domain-containing protein n=1 Tax=Shewanella litorisediminis TaxID=1173586 RepID=A0ABX7G749_9GAMM|nr:GDYXXLXY domain-containing protein [Shewanella litorisediminis]MCL2916631.1 GDYXXLXY domain-containing protein [Shewanella litorisediminis]QRH03191.1 GDYXXLXY domain-containing protein [Shewanella litorisediminis]
MKRLNAFWLTLIATFGLLAVINLDIASKERQLAEGTVVRFALAPVDPRSLMQGDYMALAYALEAPILGALTDEERAGSMTGYLWVTLDEHAQAHFFAIERGEPKPADVLRVQFRLRDGQIKLASNAWFFEEGSAARFDNAKYGEFRLGDDGSVLLSALLDEQFNAL